MTSKSTNIALMDHVFASELTQEGLNAIRDKYDGVVMDMSDDDQFKQARKIRTERNKLTESISRRRIDVSKEIKEHGDSISGAVIDIYAPIVDAFEAEDKRRKEEAERIKREREEFLNGQRKEIAQMLEWVDQAKDLPSDEISSLIDGVANIDEKCFDDELLREAIDTKTKATEDLYRLMSDAKAREKLEQERAAIAEQRRQEEQKAKINDRINNLRMMPTAYFQKSSDEIRSKVASLENYNPPQEEFLDRTEEAKQAKIQVIQQLSMMADQKAMVEAAEAENKAKAEAESEAKRQAQTKADEEAKRHAEGQTQLNTHANVDTQHETQSVQEEQPVDQEIRMTQSELNVMLQNSYIKGWDDGVKAGMPYAECMALSQQ